MQTTPFLIIRIQKLLLYLVLKIAEYFKEDFFVILQVLLCRQATTITSKTICSSAERTCSTGHIRGERHGMSGEGGNYSGNEMMLSQLAYEPWHVIFNNVAF